MKIISLILSLMVLTAASARADNNATEALGDSCMRINDTFNAMRYYGEALQTDSSDAIKEKMAHCLFMRGEYRKCAAMLEATARKGTDSLSQETMRRLFDCYRYMDNTAKQIEWGNRLLSRCPMDGIVTAYMAHIYNSDDNISSPQKAYDITARYMQTDSACLPVLREYADANFLMRDYNKAINAYNRLLELGDSTYNTVYSLGMAYMQTGKNPMARRWLTKAAEKSKMQNAGCLYRLGIVCVDMDSVAEGIDYLEKSIELMEPDHTVLFVVKRALGEGYYKQGKYWSAIYAWREALKLNRNSMATIFNTAQAYGLVGKHDMEKAYYRTFLSMAALVKPNKELNQMVEQAETAVGVKENFNGNIISLPAN